MSNADGNIAPNGMEWNELDLIAFSDSIPSCFETQRYVTLLDGNVICGGICGLRATTFSVPYFVLYSNEGIHDFVFNSRTCTI